MQIGYINTRDFNAIIKKAREFCYSKGWEEVCTQTRPSILAACEDPNTLTIHNIGGVDYALPQTGQMWLEHELLGACQNNFGGQNVTCPQNNFGGQNVTCPQNNFWGQNVTCPQNNFGDQNVTCPQNNFEGQNVTCPQNNFGDQNVTCPQNNFGDQNVTCPQNNFGDQNVTCPQNNFGDQNVTCPQNNFGDQNVTCPQNNFGDQNVTCPQNNFGDQNVTCPQNNGFFCLTASYRNEPNPILGRHQLVFPLFEMEACGGFNDMIKTWTEFLVWFGYTPDKDGNFPFVNYEDACKKYDVFEITSVEEALLYRDYGPVVFLGYFPQRSNPYWNMKYLGEDKYAKIDVILSGQEALGSAERSINTDEMQNRFHELENGQYKQTLYNIFGQQRVDAEVESFLALPMKARFGGGLGLHRFIHSLKAEKLIL